MARNVEIKAQVDDIDSLSARVAALACDGPYELEQDDTFFYCDAGRLKLRVFAGGSAELIFYRRADARGPKTSFYERTPIAAPDTLREILALAYGEAGRVRKHRRLYLIGRTRVHLDRVAALGDFIELEVTLAGDEDERIGLRQAQTLLESLGVLPHQLLEGAYLDLSADRISG